MRNFSLAALPDLVRLRLQQQHTAAGAGWRKGSCNLRFGLQPVRDLLAPGVADSRRLSGLFGLGCLVAQGGSQPPSPFGRLSESVQLYKLLHSCKSEGAPQVFSASQELGGGGSCEGTAAVVELAECDPALGCSNRGDLSISKAKPLESRFCR